MTSCPAAFIIAAATELSTPPDIATTTRRLALEAAMGCGWVSVMDDLVCSAS
jgi:hypothetical protein